MNILTEKLSASGHKITKPRRLVWKCITEAKQPLSAREIYKKTDDCDQVSVYRVLGLYESLGLIKEEIVGREKFYCSANKPHHHIICRCCGHIENFPCAHKFNKYKNFTNIEHQLTLYGVCGKCKNKV